MPLSNVFRQPFLHNPFHHHQASLSSRNNTTKQDATKTSSGAVLNVPVLIINPQYPPHPLDNNNNNNNNNKNSIDAEILPSSPHSSLSSSSWPSTPTTLPVTTPSTPTSPGFARSFFLKKSIKSKALKLGPTSPATTTAETQEVLSISTNSSNKNSTTDTNNNNESLTIDQLEVASPLSLDVCTLNSPSDSTCFPTPTTPTPTSPNTIVSFGSLSSSLEPATRKHDELEESGAGTSGGGAGTTRKNSIPQLLSNPFRSKRKNSNNNNGKNNNTNTSKQRRSIKTLSIFAKNPLTEINTPPLIIISSPITPNPGPISSTLTTSTTTTTTPPPPSKNNFFSSRNLSKSNKTTKNLNRLSLPLPLPSTSPLTSLPPPSLGTASSITSQKTPSPGLLAPPITLSPFIYPLPSTPHGGIRPFDDQGNPKSLKELDAELEASWDWRRHSKLYHDDRWDQASFISIESEYPASVRNLSLSNNDGGGGSSSPGPSSNSNHSNNSRGGRKPMYPERNEYWQNHCQIRERKRRLLADAAEAARLNDEDAKENGQQDKDDEDEDQDGTAKTSCSRKTKSAKSRGVDDNGQDIDDEDDLLPQDNDDQDDDNEDDRTKYQHLFSRVIIPGSPLPDKEIPRISKQLIQDSQQLRKRSQSQRALNQLNFVRTMADRYEGTVMGGGSNSNELNTDLQVPSWSSLAVPVVPTVGTAPGLMISHPRGNSHTTRSSKPDSGILFVASHTTTSQVYHQPIQGITTTTTTTTNNTGASENVGNKIDYIQSAVHKTSSMSNDTFKAILMTNEKQQQQQHQQQQQQQQSQELRGLYGYSLYGYGYEAHGGYDGFMKMMKEQDEREGRGFRRGKGELVSLNFNKELITTTTTTTDPSFTTVQSPPVPQPSGNNNNSSNHPHGQTIKRHSTIGSGFVMMQSSFGDQGFYKKLNKPHATTPSSTCRVTRGGLQR